jgi:DNA-binding response OmpR family regulator
MTNPSTILLVDDDAAVRKLLTFPLEREGYAVVQAADGEQALTLFERSPVDLVVLDIMLPRVDGLEVCKQLRTRSSVPIMMLSARDDELDKVLGLELGADDYVTKPFSIQEFRSRVRALLRRARTVYDDGAPSAERPIEVAELVIDLVRRTADIGSRRVKLTYVEFELLAMFARQPGRVHTRRMLLESLWGSAAFRDPRTIDVHVRHLREKIERDPREPEYILTVRSVGYRFREA